MNFKNLILCLWKKLTLGLIYFDQMIFGSAFIKVEWAVSTSLEDNPSTTIRFLTDLSILSTNACLILLLAYFGCQCFNKRMMRSSDPRDRIVDWYSLLLRRPGRVNSSDIPKTDFLQLYTPIYTTPTCIII